jgi:hypothetical protein
VHDAPLAQVVYMVLEMAADEAPGAELLRAAADVLDKLVGAGHICNGAVYGVRADRCTACGRTPGSPCRGRGSGCTARRPSRGRRGDGPARPVRRRAGTRRGRTGRRGLHVHPAGGRPLRRYRGRPRRPRGRLTSAGRDPAPGRSAVPCRRAGLSVVRDVRHLPTLDGLTSRAPAPSPPRPVEEPGTRQGHPYRAPRRLHCGR